MNNSNHDPWKIVRTIVPIWTLDHQTPDSAGTATAYLCGVKANFYTAGLSGEGKFKKCETAESSKVESVLKKAKKAGKGKPELNNSEFYGNNSILRRNQILDNDIIGIFRVNFTKILCQD